MGKPRILLDMSYIPEELSIVDWLEEMEQDRFHLLHAGKLHCFDGDTLLARQHLPHFGMELPWQDWDLPEGT